MKNNSYRYSWLICLLFGLAGCSGDSDQTSGAAPITPPVIPPALPDSPDITADVFIIYGQSNGSGSSSEKSDGQGLLWDGEAMTLNPLNDPTRYDPIQCDCGSPWPSFGTAWQTLTGNTAIVINLSEEGADIEQLSDGVAMSTLVKWVENFYQYAQTQVTITSHSVIFVHGENDAEQNLPVDEYQSKLDLLYQKLNTVIPQAFDFYVTRVPNVNEQSWAFGEQIINYAYEHDNMTPVFVKTVTFNKENGLLENDGFHLTLKANAMMGKEIAKNILVHQSGADIGYFIFNESNSLEQ